MSHSTDSLSCASSSEITSRDTESEFASYASSNEENLAIAKELEIKNHNDIYTDRFKVHSNRLQKLLESECEFTGVNKAEEFFEDVMKKTETYISWPKRITDDSSRGNDPYVHVCGKQDDISWAKGLILNKLKTSDKRLKLRIIIPNNDHRFIVGRENNNLIRIMEFTDTIVELPYSSQRNMAQKGNQVVIEGSLEGIDQARIQLRTSMPLIMSFKIPSNHSEPRIDLIKDKYNIQVIVTDQGNSVVVFVKGSLRRIEIVKDAIRELINSTYNKHVGKPVVSVHTEVPPLYQDFVKGERNEKLLQIMEETKTKIFFPDLINATTKQRSQVTIIGAIDDVCEARQRLVSNFPIEMIFDIPGYYQYNTTDILNMGTKFGVRITVAQKEQECGLTVTIRGVEKNIQRIYEVYQDILSLQSAIPDKGEVPKAFYLLEGAYQRVMGDLAQKYLQSVVTDSQGNTNLNDALSYSYLQAAQTGRDLEKFCSSQIYENPLQGNTTCTPDSGHESPTDFRAEIQAIDWTYTPDVRLESEETFRAEDQPINWALFGSEPIDSFSKLCLAPSEEKIEETICSSIVPQMDSHPLTHKDLDSLYPPSYGYGMNYTTTPRKERDVFADLRNGISPGNYL